MTIKAWALDGTYSAADARLLLTGLPLAGATAGRPLGVRSGVRPGTPASTVTTTQTTWTVAPHAGVIDAQTSTTAGAYGYAVTAAETGNLQAAHATYSRIDLLSVQITDTSQGNSGTSGATVVYTAGTPASSPVAPATPARSLAIAQITVPPSGSPVVTWVAPTLTAAGGIIPVRGVADRTGLPAGTLVYRADAPTGQHLEITYDGTTWLTIPAGAAAYNATVAAGWSGTARVQKIGQMAFVIGYVTRTGGDLDCQAWSATPVLSGLPPAMAEVENQSPVLSNNDEFPAFHWNVTTYGVAAMGCRWISRRIANGSWHQINHAYLIQ